MQTKTIIPNRHFESTIFGSFTKGEARDVPANYAAHFVEAGVADYAPATLSDLASELLARAGIASGQDQAQNATNDQAATEVTGDAEKPASGPEIASDDAAGAGQAGDQVADQADAAGAAAADQVDQADPAAAAAGDQGAAADQVDQGAADQAATEAAPKKPRAKKGA